MAVALPQINASHCQSWTPQQQSLYYKMPLFMRAKEVQFQKRYGDWKKYLGSQDWEQNQGDTMRLVISEPPPVIRQQAFPSYVCTPPKVDITQSRERIVDSKVRHHKFRSPQFSWCPGFVDFMKGRVGKNLKYVFEQQEHFTSMFYRSFIFHQSPNLFIADGQDSTLLGSGYSAGLDMGAPQGDGDDAGTTGKTDAYLSQMLPNIGTPGTLSFRQLRSLLSIMTEDIGAVPYQSGSVEDDLPVNDMFMCLTDAETYDSFHNDPYFKEMSPLTNDGVHSAFKGKLWDRISFSLHKYPLRILHNPDGTISWPAPETIEENPAAPNFGQTVPNPDYRRAQYTVSFFVGYEAYDIIKVGPPPAEWANAGMKWNGKPFLTDDFLVQCGVDSNSNPIMEANTEKEWLRIMSHTIMGIVGHTKRNILPIIHRRSRGITTRLI